jgi:hypothetical protein
MSLTERPEYLYGSYYGNSSGKTRLIVGQPTIRLDLSLNPFYKSGGSDQAPVLA